MFEDAIVGARGVVTEFRRREHRNWHFLWHHLPRAGCAGVSVAFVFTIMGLLPECVSTSMTGILSVWAMAVSLESTVVPGTQ